MLRRLLFRSSPSALLAHGGESSFEFGIQIGRFSRDMDGLSGRFTLQPSIQVFTRGVLRACHNLSRETSRRANLLNSLMCSPAACSQEPLSTSASLNIQRECEHAHNIIASEGRVGQDGKSLNPKCEEQNERW